MTIVILGKSHRIRAWRGRHLSAPTAVHDEFGKAPNPATPRKGYAGETFFSQCRPRHTFSVFGSLSALVTALDASSAARGRLR
jgi:hypothetical protein